MLSVKSLGSEKNLVKDTDYKTNELVYKGSGSGLFIARAVKNGTRELYVTIPLPFFMSDVPSVSMTNCRIASDEDGTWKQASFSGDVIASRNVVQFKVTVSEDLNNQGSYYFVIPNGSTLTLTWGGVTLKGLLHKIKHFFHIEEVLA